MADKRMKDVTIPDAMSSLLTARMMRHFLEQPNKAEKGSDASRERRSLTLPFLSLLSSPPARFELHPLPFSFFNHQSDISENISFH